MMAAILNLLMFSDQEDGYLKRNVHSFVGCQTVIKYSAIVFPTSFDPYNNDCFIKKNKSYW